MRSSNIDIHTSIMLLAETWARCRSKDPNTQVGAVVHDRDTGTMYFGYNGFPKGINDTELRWERPTKYNFVIHAEINAIDKALMGCGRVLDNCVLYTTHKPCHRCMGKIIQSGIRTVYFRHKHDDDKITDELTNEAHVDMIMI